MGRRAASHVLLGTRVACAGGSAGDGGRHVHSRHRYWAAAGARRRPTISHFFLALISTSSMRSGLGVFAHNWIHDESAPVDARRSNCCRRRSRFLALPDNPWFGWFFRPRASIILGGMINTGGKDELRLHRSHLADPDLRAGVFRGRVRRLRQQWPGASRGRPHLHGLPDQLSGASGGFGVQLTSNIDIIASVEHNSHATFCTHIHRSRHHRCRRPASATSSKTPRFQIDRSRLKCHSRASGNP